MSVRVLALLVVLVALVTPAAAYDARETFRKGAIAVSVEGGYGEQSNVTKFEDDPGLEFWNAGARVGVLPFVPFEAGPVSGALEVGLGPLYQRYLAPFSAHFLGLAATLRYHFLSLGRMVPYAEVTGAAGHSTLRTVEIRSDFSFLVQAGVGLSAFVTDRTALYAGYRFQHVSNGNTEDPNRGFESHSGVVGVSVFFP